MKIIVNYSGMNFAKVNWNEIPIELQLKKNIFPHIQNHDEWPLTCGENRYLDVFNMCFRSLKLGNKN